MFDSHIELPKVRIELNTERASKETYIGDNLMLEALVAKYKTERVEDAETMRDLTDSLNKTKGIIPYVVGGGVIVGLLLGVATALALGG